MKIIYFIFILLFMISNTQATEEIKKIEFDNLTIKEALIKILKENNKNYLIFGDLNQRISGNFEYYILETAITNIIPKKIYDYCIIEKTVYIAPKEDITYVRYSGGIDMNFGLKIFHINNISVEEAKKQLINLLGFEKGIAVNEQKNELILNQGVILKNINENSFGIFRINFQNIINFIKDIDIKQK